MLEVNDDAMRERNAGANGTGSATEPTNETAAKKYVSALPGEHEQQPAPLRVAERVHGVADVRELREQEVERRGQRDDRQQRARADPFEPLERHLGRSGAFLHVRAQVVERELAGGEAAAHRAGGKASGCRSGRAAATRSRPRPSTAASTAGSTPTSSDVSTSSWATSRERWRSFAASSASSKSTRCGRFVRVDDHVLEREVAVRDARPIERRDLPPEPVEELPVDPRAVDLGQAFTRARSR